MKLGHCSEISRESLAYPYPGRSVKINSGFGLPAIRNSKKLMARVRPGVELVRANLVPTRELITLDLPTFDRPRKAISGRLAAGKCLASLAESKNLERIRTLQFPISNGKLQAAHRKRRMEEREAGQDSPAILTKGLRSKPEHENGVPRPDT